MVEIGNGGTSSGLVTQLDYQNAINMGSAPVYVSGTVTPGPFISFNFEFNAATTWWVLKRSRWAIRKRPTTLSVLGPDPALNQQLFLGSVFAGEPDISGKLFETVPRYTGTRVSAIQATGSNSLGPRFVPCLRERHFRRPRSPSRSPKRQLRLR